MKLSVCLIASTPASRLAAVLEPVRGLADEVIVAADARVDEATLAGYAALADRLFRIEFSFYERHLAWLYAQCSGEWILRLEDDEVVSAALAARLPELLTARDVQQYWIARTWLFPDAQTVLDEAPWSTDFHNRLVRNDGTLRVRGALHVHADPVAPCEYIEDAVHHLDLLDSNVDERRDKSVRYEVINPLITAAGGGRANEAFYLPELRSSLKTRPLPEADRPLVERALDGRRAVTPGAGVDVPLVPAAEVDRHWEGRTVPESGYRTHIEPVGSAPTLAPDATMLVPVSVRNDGTEVWPRGLDRHPAIRASYRWRHPDGSVHTADGLRTGFSRDVHPGRRVLVPLEVVAPSEPGSYILEVDLVHEYVRWFEQPCHMDVQVTADAAHALPPTSPRLRESPRPPARRVRRPRLRLPRTLHRVWVGAAEMPAAHEEFGRSFERHHPGWEARLWTDADLPALEISGAEQSRARSPAELSNVVRFEVLRRFGGVYVDTDVECKRPLDDLLAGVEAFAALELPGRVGTGVIGGVPGHRAFERAARLSRRTLGLGLHSADANGPYLMSLILEQEPGVTIFGADKFYPYHWEEPERAGDPFPDAYAVHHWSTSWWGQEGAA